MRTKCFCLPLFRVRCKQFVCTCVWLSVTQVRCAWHSTDKVSWRALLLQQESYSSPINATDENIVVSSCERVMQICLPRLLHLNRITWFLKVNPKLCLIICAKFENKLVYFHRKTNAVKFLTRFSSWKNLKFLLLSPLSNISKHLQWIPLAMMNDFINNINISSEFVRNI